MKISLRKKVLFSAVTTIFFLVAFEFVLGFVGFEPHTNNEDPFVGFSGLLPLMELSTNEAGEQILSTAQNKRHWFNAQSFPKIKKPGTKRIFCMGGSTTYGHPYWDSTSFPGWLREFLPLVDPAHEWEVINAGGISYASYRVAAVMDELAQYEPDLFIVYSVHNEFLERRTYENMFDTSTLSLHSQALLSRTRTWALANRIIHQARSNVATPASGDSTKASVDVLNGEVDEILNHTAGPVDYHRDDAWRAKVLDHYEANLRRMVSIADRAGAKIVFITPTANEKNCSPFKSEHGQRITSSDAARLATLVHQTENGAGPTEVTNAMPSLEEAIKIDPVYAEYQYRLGQSYLAIDRFADAQAAFARALDEDVCPLRAVVEIRKAIERVVLESNVPMVDFEQKLRQLCEAENGHSIFGDEYFLDHVHPTIDVNRRLALWIIEALQANEIVQGTNVFVQGANLLVQGTHEIDQSLAERLSMVEAKVLGRIDHEVQAYARRNLAKVIHWAGKFEQAIPHAKAVLETLPSDPESRYILARCFTNLGKQDEAIQEYERLFTDGVDYPRAYLPFGELLAEKGSWERARAYLLMAVLHDPKDAAAYYSLGLVHLRLNEFQFAIESLQESNRLYPNDAETLFHLAQAKAAKADLRSGASATELVPEG